MEVVESEVFNFTPLTGDLRPMGEGRPSGLHLSQIVHRMKVDAGENVGELPGDQPGIAMQTGFLFEMALEYAFREFMGVQRTIERQRHLLLDRVHGTPDGFDRERWVLEEDKSTTRSMRAWEEDPLSFWTWLVQTKGYLKMVAAAEGKPVNLVEFFILFFYGDYSRKPGRGRQIRRTLLYFPDEEIDAQWRVTLRYRDVLEMEQEREALDAGHGIQRTGSDEAVPRPGGVGAQAVREDPPGV